jgi:Short C-terminal domain
VVRPTIAIGLSLAGVACALTMVYLSMRAVMDVGGFCAEGGPFEIETHCPQGVPGVMVGSLWGGILLAGVYVWQVVRHNVPNFVGLLWPALFLSLGWNFLDYAFDPPGTQGGVVWGWLICGIVFVLMGGLPLLVMLPATVHSFTRERERPQGWPLGMPLAHMQKVAARVQPMAAAAGDAGGAVVDELERLAKLHERGALTDDEYAAAKRMLL